MTFAKTALTWVAIALAFFVAVGLLTMTADKPPEDLDAPKPPASAAP